MLLTCIIFSVLLVSCSVKTDSTVDSSPGAENTETTKSAREYRANKEHGFNMIYDYDNVLSVCNEALVTYVQAVKDNDEADFTPYIDNDNLLKYLKYRVENHPYSYTKECTIKPMVTEVKFCDDYVLVTVLAGIMEEPDGFSLQGNNYFLVENVDGRLCISEWYWDHMDSPDVELRGEFSEENNLRYWELPEKYEPVLNTISDGKK